MAATVAFALVVVQHPDDDKFCLVHEKGARGWWLPGGGVDAGQRFDEAAVREAEEEAGVDCVLTGVLRVETCGPHGGRLRIIFHARPRDANRPLKSKADHHSRGARWVTLEELRQIKDGVPPEGVARDTCYLRGEEPWEWFRYIAAGGAVHPLAALQMLQRGSVPAWPGPGDPPRAVYRTSFTISLALLREGQVAVEEQSGGLPSWAPPPGASLQDAARACAASLGAAAVSGIAQLRHILDVRAADEAEHGCHFDATFVAPWERPEPPRGCRWRPAGRPLPQPLLVHGAASRGLLAAGSPDADAWVCSTFAEEDAGPVLQAAAAAVHGCALACGADFPLESLPATATSVVICSAPVSDEERRRLLRRGAASVLDGSSGTAAESLSSVLGTARYPGLHTAVLPLTLLGSEMDRAPKP